ncbi:protein ALWAYS EARLY 2 isoform X3 [Senna tora]|uniref:Protein ALWAYS EARLY 2 isoform X3 n=1 Tax=Senna tora TaxID=362788 RepID=A0A834SK53_9FABA|nr:protein ALWAYS EARLY 2 isoform X3 [Senna tora]
MAYRPFSILLIRRISLSPINPKPCNITAFFLPQLLTSKPFSTTQDPASNPKPSSLSARLSFVFDQIDAIEKEREQKDQTLQRIRAWRESKKIQSPQNDTSGQESGLGSAAGVNHNSNDAGLAESKLEATWEGEKGGEVVNNVVEVVHPWPEWIELMERLVQQNYFDHRRRDEDKLVRDLGFDDAVVADDVGFDFTRDFKSVQTACLNFGKDRFDILRSLSRQDIQILVGFGCPTVDKKVVFSAKLLRKHVHLDEGDVCSSCSLRNSCERAYLLTNKEDEARTIDIMRVLLAFGFDPVNGSTINKSLPKQKSVKTVVRKLLHEVVKLSSVPIDPNLPPPVIKKPPPKVKQPPPPPKKRVGRDDVEMKKGDWLCPKCDFLNFAKNTVCLQCDAKRPKRQLLPGEWECPECNFLNYRRNTVCFHCECKRPPDEFLENKMQDKQHTFNPRMDKISSRKEVSNAWNFDFDDDESDGADVAAFEYADAHAIDEDFPLDAQAQRGNFGGREGDFEKISRAQGSHDGGYSNPDLNRPGIGFDDFEDEDDIDSYELETHSNSTRVKASKSDFSEDDSSGLEDIEDYGDKMHAHKRTASKRSVRSGSYQRDTSFSGSDNDDLTFDSNEQRSFHSNFKSSRVSAAAQKGKGRGPTKKLSFGSDSDDDFVGGLYSEEDEDLNEGYASRQSKRSMHGSGRRNFTKDRQSRRANLFSDDDYDGSSRQSYSNSRGPQGNVRNGRGSQGNGRSWQRYGDRERGTQQYNKSTRERTDGSGRRNFTKDRQSRRASMFSDDSDGSSRQSYSNGRGSRGNGRSGQRYGDRERGTQHYNKSTRGRSEKKQGGGFNKYHMDEKDFGEFRNSKRVDKRLMAPTRKSRSVNKRFSSLNEASPDKDGVNLNKNKHRKKKLSDKLGSQWSKEELERFYEAYRKYGKDWKKVATVVRNRSTEMVEALYNMNRAYLSLPEGTASVVGLIAMMTDHYNVLEGSDSERESSDAPGSQKLLKRKRGKVHLSFSKNSAQCQPIASNDGCLSLLKRRHFDGSQPRAVGKRTPRIPVSHSHKNRENFVSPIKRSLKSESHANDDEVAHVAALALTEAAQRGGSPHISQTKYRRAEQKSSPVESWSKTARAKFQGASADEEWLEGSMESGGAENGEYAKDTSSLMGMEGVGTVEVHQKGKKIYRKKERVENVRNHQLDDGGEACSGTEEGLYFDSLKEKVDVEVTNAKPEQSPKFQRKRSKKLFFGDESSALDALQTLADLSLMMPESTMESESSVQLKEERMTVDKDDKSALPEATFTSQNRDKTKLPGAKQKVLHAVPGVETSTSRRSKLGREFENDNNASAESKEQLPPSDRTWTRKRKSVVSKISNSKLDPHPSYTLNNEAAVDESKPMIKGKHSGQVFALPKQLKSVKSSDSSLCSDPKDIIVSTVEVPPASEVSFPNKQRSRRKMSPQRIFMPHEKSCENMLKSQPSKYSTNLQDRASYLKEKLSGCLSSYMVRRWCTFEWFYSAIDYPWFAKREFVEYLNHVGLGNIPRLTRVEWSVIKSSLGKPRRFSEHFLCEERQKLEQYRESVRKHYTELRTGTRDGLPTDLARPLFVGQRVIAIHPKSREVHDGSVLTVDHDKCRIQFDRPELGVEFVMDIDCMPMNPLDNMPEALRRQIGTGKVSCMMKQLHINEISNFGGCAPCASGVPQEKVSTPSSTLVKQGKGDVNHAIAQAKASTIDNIATLQEAYAQPCTLTHHQAREADIRALSELSHALDKKLSYLNLADVFFFGGEGVLQETLLMELRNANSEILENQNDIDCFKDSESFKKHYATVSSALLNLRQRNTYTGNFPSPWVKPQASFNVHDDPCTLDSSLAQELGSTVIEIIKGSRLRAHAMVDAAIQTLSSTKEGEDAFMRQGQLLDSVDYQHSASNSRLPVIRSQEQVNGSCGHHDQSTYSAQEPLHSDASVPKLLNDSDKVDAQIPSELITSCVATLIMIQTCTERQYPPADVAQILDSAVNSLHPCCPQNLPIYREIKMCMGRIKTQILALIPT